MSRATQHLFIVNPIQQLHLQGLGASRHASRYRGSHRSPAQSGQLSAGLAAAFDLQGHRGARGLAPENTLAGFKVALDLGVTTLETDLAITRDGVVVISHDPLLNPDLTRGPDGQSARSVPAQSSAR